jgi:hypothetical protein
MHILTHGEKIARNEALPCDVEGCGRRRNRLSRWCGSHRNRAGRSGHPLQRTILPYQWRTEKIDVRELLTANPTHRGLLLAEKFLADWLANRGRFAVVTKAHPVREALRRHGATPRDVVIAASAIWLFAERYPTVLPDDERLTHAMARAVIGLMPAERRRTPRGNVEHRRPGTAARREIGEVLRGELGVLFQNIAHAVQHKDERAREQRETLAAPFGIAEGTTRSNTK